MKNSFKCQSLFTNFRYELRRRGYYKVWGTNKHIDLKQDQVVWSGFYR
jgi:hypothetical protein